MPRIEIELGLDVRKWGDDFKDLTGKTQQWVKKVIDSFGGIDSSVQKLARALGLDFSLNGLVEFTKECVMASAELEVLRSNFQGTTEDIELFKKATAGTVTEANLLKLSNQATDLGLSIQDQAKLFVLAEQAGDKYGVSLEEAFQKVVLATEGNTKGLKMLGIQKAVYENIVNDLALAHGKELNDLDAETQKMIRMEAILRATGITMEDVANQTTDAKDRFERFGIAVEESKSAFGDFIRDAGKGWLDIVSALSEGGLVFSGVFMRANIQADILLQNLERIKAAYREAITEAGKQAENSAEGKSAAQLQVMINDTKAKIAAMKKFAQENGMDAISKNDLEQQERKLQVFESTLSLMFKKEKGIAEKIAKEKEQILKSYYEGVKFIDEGYYNYRIGLIDNEKNKMKSAGLDKLKLEQFEQEERKKLNADFMRWLQKEFPWLFDKAGNIVKGISLPINFVYGNNTLKEVKPINKPTFDLGTDAAILENWIKESELAGLAMDNFVSSAIAGIDDLKITIGNDATFMSRAFTNFANTALRAIEQIIAKWAVLNLFAFLGGAPGVNLFSMLGLAEGGVINEPIAGIGASGQRYLLGEKGSELVLPLSKIGLLNNIAQSGQQQTNHLFNIKIEGTSKIDGKDIHQAWSFVESTNRHYR
jgi:hypothetical protein